MKEIDRDDNVEEEAISCLSPTVQEKPTCLKKMLLFFTNLDNLVITFTVLAVVLGLTIGILVKLYSNPSYRLVYLISFPGVLLMNMLKMLIIPLIVSSLVTGLCGLDAKSSGKIGFYAMLYYVVTTALAVILGIILVLSIHPGVSKNKIENQFVEENHKQTNTLDSFMDLFRNLFPENIVRACLEQQKSEYLSVPNKKNASENITIIVAKYVDSTNVLGLVSFSVAIGLILGQMGEKALVMVQFFAILNEVVMRLVKIIMWYSPVGIFFLILGKVLEIENLQDTATSLGMYMTTVVLGLAIHSLGTLAIVYAIICRKNPFKFYKGIFQAWITALGTASSAATLPITFKCLEENLSIDKRVTRFVLPIGATINMDGTALYEAVASIFIAQINDKQLSITEVIIISVTATLAAIGAASVPSAGLVTMILVLTSVGLPIDDITLILAVDWLLDRIRTSVNVVGDAVGAGIVDHLCRNDLAIKDHEAQIELDNAIADAVRIRNEKEAEDLSDGGKHPAKRISSSWRSSSRKRLSIAAAMRLQDHISPTVANVAASMSIDEFTDESSQNNKLE